MKYLTAGLLALMATGASGQTAEELGVTLTIVEPDDQGFIGEIVHHNRLTSYHAEDVFFDFETEIGAFQIRILTTPNGGCRPACPDTVELWDWPETIIPSALEVTTPEHGFSRITLHIYQGS